MKNKKTSLTFIVSVYNGVLWIEKIIDRIQKFWKDNNYKTRVIFIDDGSTDDSLKMLAYFASKNRRKIKVLSLSRHFGFDMAIMAGIEHCKTKYAVILDEGLEVNIKIINEMIEKAKSGYDIVSSECISKRKIDLGSVLVKLSNSFLTKLVGEEINEYGDEIRLINRKVMLALKLVKNRSRLLQSLFFWIGYKKGVVYYKNEFRDRPLVKVNWFKKNLIHSLDILFSYSNRILKLSVGFGLFIVLLGFFVGLFLLYLRFFTPYTIPGITAVIAAVVIMGGVQIVMLGVIGGYVGKIFENSSDGSKYHIKSMINMRYNDNTDEESEFEKEENFHDNWANSVNIKDVLVDEFFEVSTVPENKFLLSKTNNLKGVKILEIGCGLGEASVYFAKRGAEVVASDVSGMMLDLVKKVAKYHKVNINVCKCTSDNIPFNDNTFDYVYAGNVLHHVDIETSLIEIRRVLKKGGKLLSWDPLDHNPIINVYRSMAYDVRTEDEHPIKFSQIELFKKQFSKVEYTTTWFFSLWIFLKYYLIDKINPNTERYWKRILRDEKSIRLYEKLEKYDKILFKIFPWMRRYSWNIVLVAEK